MEYNQDIINKAFTFSMRLIKLYALLIRKNEFELSEKLLKSGINIRENIEEAITAASHQDFAYKISLASQEAVQTRYWLKQIQMRHTVNTSCDECVESINEIINMLIYMGQERSKYKLNTQYQLN